MFIQDLVSHHELAGPLTNCRSRCRTDQPDATRCNGQRLVNDILDIEAIERDRMAFAFQQVEMKPLVEEAIETNRAFAATFDVVVRLG